jgi:hypothetical protein
LEWITKDGTVIREDELPDVSDSHLLNWLRYAERVAAGADSAIGAPDDDTSNAAGAALDYYGTWAITLDEERKRRGLPR